MEKKQVIMTEGPIKKEIVQFAIPLLIGNLFQQLYNTADSVLVGNFLGRQDLAAVSAAGNLIFLLVGFTNGLAVGAGAVIARQFGAKQYEAMRTTIHSLTALGLLAGGVLTGFGILFSRKILILLRTPPQVLEGADSYLRVYFAGVIGLVLYNIFASVLQAVGDSRHPLYFLISASVVNIGLDALFLLVLGWQVWSAAFATVLSQLLAAGLCLFQLSKSGQSYRISLAEIRPDKSAVKEILKYGLPSGLQNCVVGLSNVLIQSKINLFGEAVIAGCGAYQKIEGFGLLPITSLSLALTTFVGQNLGAQKKERVKEGVRFGLICCVLAAELVGIFFFAAAPAFVSAFNDNRQVIEAGTMYARTVTLFYVFPACTHSLAGVLRGAGKPLLFWFIMRRERGWI